MFELFTGASILSEALKFSLDDEVSSPHSNNYGSIVGGILALVIFIMVVTAILAYAKSKNLLKLKKANNGVAFENPSYLKEANIEQVTVSNEQFLQEKVFHQFIFSTSHRYKQFHQILSKVKILNLHQPCPIKRTFKAKLAVMQH